MVEDPSNLQTDDASPKEDMTPEQLAALMGTAQFEELVRKTASSLVSELHSVKSTAESPGRKKAVPQTSEPDEHTTEEPVDGGSDNLPAAPEGAQPPVDGVEIAMRMASVTSREARGALKYVVDFMKSIKVSSLNDVQRLRFRSAQSSIASVQSTLDTVLDLSAIDADEFRTQPVEFGIRDALKPWIKLISQPASSTGVKLVCDVDPQVPHRVIGDVGRLQRLFIYCTHYALSFAREDDIKIGITLLSEDHDGTAIRIAVRHDGNGMTAEQTDQALLRPRLDDGISAADRDRAANVAMYQKLAQHLDGDMGIEAISTTGFEIWFAMTLQNPDSEVGDRRGPGRHHTAFLRCDLGDILDMSTGGIRIMSRKMLSGEVPVKLYDMHSTLRLNASVVWVKKHGFRKHEVGLRFIDLNPHTEAAVERLWLDHSNRSI